MAKIEAWYEQDLKRPVRINYLDGSFFNQDAAGSRIGVKVYSDGQAVTLAGSITGYCVQADGTTVPISGTRSGNTAYIDIPQSALSVPGPLTVTIKNTESSVITTLCAVVGIVTQSRTGVQVDPGQTVTDWTNQISAQLQACQDAADNVGAIVAVPYASLTFPVEVNTYTTHNGNLYCCTTRIATSESFTAAHWRQTNVCREISDLKSAFTNITNGTPIEYERGYTLKTDLSVGNTININSKTANQSAKYAIAPCSPGDKITINGTGGSGARLYCFTNSSYQSLGASEKNLTANDLILTAPDTAAYIIINDLADKQSFIGTSVDNRISELSNAIEEIYIDAKRSYVNSSTYAVVLPDANTANANTVYVLLGNGIETAHLPQANYSGDIGVFVYIKSDAAQVQYLLWKSIYWKRYGYNNVWQDWIRYDTDRIVIRVGATEEYTELSTALETAYTIGNCDVYVDSGEYDLFDELGGANYFNSYEFVEGEKSGGPVVGHNCNYYFSPGAIVTFHNTTSNIDVMKTFSPFNAGNGNFMIDGLVIRCSKCRYAFHDEMTHTGLYNRKTVQHIFNNVDFYKDNTNNTAFANHHCIGGGLISHGGEVVTIMNSYFKSAVAGEVLVSYHNGLGGSNLPSKSKVTITGCYFDNGGTTRLASYGDNGTDTDDKTVMFVTNCNLGSEPVHELNRGAAEWNTLLYSWNNIIRN